MHFFAQFGLWDVLLLLAVPVQATFIAYLHSPRQKAFVLTLPFPFTLAMLAVGRPIGVTHIAGLALLLLFTHCTRILHVAAKVPIVPSIAISAMVYCLLGWALVPVLPTGEVAFWVTAGVVFLLAIVLYLRTPHRIEPGYRSPLPIWVKFPAILAVIAGLVMLKSVLHGFMTVFPMVGVVTAYEARHSLWAICRQIPVIILTLLPMMITIRSLQGVMGVGGSLAIGWAVFLILLTLLYRNMLTRDHGVVMESKREKC